MSQDIVKVGISVSAHKRLKLLSIIEKKSMLEIMEDVIKERYGLHRIEIEELIRSANNPTKIKE
ncbi:hypothetical protein KKF84_08850 [Myxococcota bacterium]|nr:hypothetical protein [Myxococcota bacterium]MBU1535417.1 hypothetical protein [Myxococcota bacterium]